MENLRLVLLTLIALAAAAILLFTSPFTLTFQFQIVKPMPRIEQASSAMKVSY